MAFDFVPDRIHTTQPTDPAVVAGLRISLVTVASLVIESGPRQGEVLPLERGVYVLGRAEGCAVRFDSGTMSGQHCELTVSELGVKVRDLQSSNGTAVEGRLVAEAELKDGERLVLGDVELRVVIPPVRIAIPELSEPEPVGPAFLPDGQPACDTHRDQAAAFRCVHCQRTFCDGCVRRLGLAGGPLRLLCPVCSYPCEAIEGVEGDQEGGSFAARLMRQVRVAFDFRRGRRGGRRGR